MQLLIIKGWPGNPNDNNTFYKGRNFYLYCTGFVWPGMTLQEAHTGAGSLQDQWSGAHTGAGLVTLWRTHSGSVCEELQPVWGIQLEELCRTASHGRDPTWDQGKGVRSSAPGQEGAAETTCDELTEPLLPFPRATAGKEVENPWLRSRQVRKERWGERF